MRVKQIIVRRLYNLRWRVEADGPPPPARKRRAAHAAAAVAEDPAAQKAANEAHDSLETLRDFIHE